MTPPEANKRSAPVKSERAFRTISEVSEELGVPQHVLRFWETRFAQVRPIKRNGGRRLYRPDHVALLRGIRALLYDDALTIKGVQKVLRERGVRAVIARGSGDAGLGIQQADPAATAEKLAAIRDRLEAGGTPYEAAPELPFDAPPDTAGEEATETTGGNDGNGPRLSAEDEARVRESIARLEDILARLEHRD